MNQEDTMKWEAANESYNKLEKLYKGCKFSLETQKKINEQKQQTILDLNETLTQIIATEESYDDEQTVLGEIYSKAREALAEQHIKGDKKNGE